MNEIAVSSLPRVTYSNINEDFSGVHAVLDRVIPDVKAKLGRVHPNFIDGRDNREGAAYEAPYPVDRSLGLGTFFAASPAGTVLVAETVPLHRGRRTQVWETKISHGNGRLAAKVTQTQMVL